jgi:hypothetical protein
MAYEIKRVGKKNPVFERLQKKYPELDLRDMLKMKWVFEAGKDTPEYRILLTQKGFEQLRKPKEKIEKEKGVWEEGLGLLSLSIPTKEEKKKGKKSKEDDYEAWMKESRKALRLSF